MELFDEMHNDPMLWHLNEGYYAPGAECSSSEGNYYSTDEVPYMAEDGRMELVRFEAQANPFHMEGIRVDSQMEPAETLLAEPVQPPPSPAYQSRAPARSYVYATAKEKESEEYKNKRMKNNDSVRASRTKKKEAIKQQEIENKELKKQLLETERKYEELLICYQALQNQVQQLQHVINTNQGYRHQ